MNQDPAKNQATAEAEAEIDQIIIALGPERARELLELALTDLVTGQDPEAETPQSQ
jgi:hypothetical protein